MLIEDNLAEARLLQELLKGSVLHRANLTHVQRLTEAIAHCDHHPVDVVLLDLTLPDSYGLASLDTLLDHVPGLPVVVLTNTNDDDLAVEAVRRGAQDYLFKRQVNPEVLVRSLRYAIERQQGEEALREANETLELRVQQRTLQLESANQLLRQEIQERQHTQERLALAQQAAKMGTFEWQLGTNEVIWSAEVEALYGVEPGTFDGNYDTWMQTIYADDRLAIEQALQQAITAHQPLDKEFRILKNPHEVRWMAVKSNVFYDTQGCPLRMIGIHMDITENKQLEAKFLRAQRLESLGTLASGIAHDLNNILTPILGVAQLLPLKIPDVDEPTRELLNTLENSARRGSSLIKQILSFARGIEGKRIALQVPHILREVRQIMAQTLPKSIEIILAVDADLWTVSGDLTQLHQVFMNLCVNARDAMPQGGSLWIQASNVQLNEAASQLFPEAHPGAYVRVTVIDTGKGMTPEIIARIFDPFFTTKAVGQGTGLGLSAVLGIVKSHGGFVDVQSQVNQGSQFAIYLPANQAEIATVAADLEILTGRQETILVVDDEVAVREVMKATLETYDYQVLTADNGHAAIALYREQKANIDLLLIDMMMPGMDGATMMPLMQYLNPEAKAIAMSGLSSPSDLEQIYNLGFQEFLAKPITTQALLTTLRRCLEA
ncbi:MAG: response regulator [Cyanobacteria bacterium P01_F01_bin.86]